MKYIKVVLEPIKIKGDLEDEDQLRVDVLERVMAMCESETLAWHIDEDEEESDDSDY
jgi:hypothetical protein